MAKKGASFSYTLPDGTQVTLGHEDASKLLQRIGTVRTPMIQRPIHPFRQPRVQPYPFRKPMSRGPATVQPYPIVTADKGIKKAPQDMLVLIRKGESVIPTKKKRK